MLPLGEREPIVTQELVDKVNTTFLRRGAPCGRTRNDDAEPFVLSGKLFCGLCGSAVSGTSAGRKKTNRYYRCNKTASGGGHACALRKIPQGKLEEQVIEAFREGFLTDGFLEELIDVAQERSESAAKDNIVALRAAKKQLADVERRRKNLLLAVEDGAVSMRDIKQRMEELNSEALKLEEKIALLERPKTEVPPIWKWNLAEFRQGLIGILNMGRSGVLRRICEDFVERVTLYPDKIHVDFYWSPSGTKKETLRESGNSLQKVGLKTGAGGAHGILSLRFSIVSTLQK